MDETPLFLAKEYHRELLDIVTHEQRTNGLINTSPTARERIYLRLGNSLINLGERLKSNAAPPMQAKMVEDCA